MAKCTKHPEIGDFESECPVCSDPVDFWPVADWDSPELHEAIKKLPRHKRKPIPTRPPSLKYPLTW